MHTGGFQWGCVADVSAEGGAISCLRGSIGPYTAVGKPPGVIASAPGESPPNEMREPLLAIVVWPQPHWKSRKATDDLGGFFFVWRKTNILVLQSNFQA
jgi:hypothetical protein